MKKIYLLFLVFLFSAKFYSQVSNYIFSQSNGTYQEITGGTVLATATAADYPSSFDNVVWNLPSGTIPFSFKFNDVSYTGLNVNSNGYITFGATTSSTSSYTPISSTTAYEGAISAWGRDINGAFHSSIVSDVSWKVEGASPNREFVIQYKNVRPSPSTSVTAIYAMNFQIRLLENGNVIKFIYGTNGFVLGTTNATGTPQIGLRGLTNSDYLNRSNSTSVNFTSSVAGTSNSSTQAYNTATGAPGMPTNGLIYTFTPPPICMGTPNGGTVSSATQVGCATTAVTVPFANSGFSGFVYQWQESDDNGVLDPWSDVTGATTLSYTPPPVSGSTSKYYRLKTTCSGSGQVAYSTVHTVTIPATPNAATSMTFTNVTDSGLTVNWTNGNGDRRVLLVNTSNNFSSLPVSGAAYVNGTPLSGGDLLIWDGTAATVNITGLTCNTTYYFRLYEYKRCGASPNYVFLHATPINGTITTNNYVPTIASLPASTNFSGFTGTNLSTVFPGWEEKVGDGPLTGTTSAWVNSSLLVVPTAKINLFTNTRKEWIVSPTVTVNSVSRVRFKAAITDFASGSPDPAGMQGTDDKVQVMISSDACGGNTWIPLYTFDATTTINLTNVLTEYKIDIPLQYISQNIRIGFKATDGPVTNTPDYDFHITDVFIENTPPPTVAVTKTDILCHGGTGTATATVTNGVSPLTYSWSPSGGTAATATGLTPGTYTVTVTDAASRTATANVTITEPDTLLSNIVATNITCNGSNNGSIVLAPTGGVAPYTYLWNNSATTSSLTGLSAGTYSVTITDANGCTKTETATIIDPAVLTVSNTSQTDVSWYGGNDGEATVTVTGGTAPYSYLWSNGATTATAQNLIAGTYIVTITDVNGCVTTQSFTIIQPIPLMVQSTSKTNVKCNGGTDGTATILAIGGNAPYTYLWSPSGGTNATATGLAAGTYSVLVTDSTANTITETFVITEPGVIAATVSHQNNVLCNGGNNGTATITVTGGTSPFTYAWSHGLNTTNATVSNLTAGNYTVLVTDANGCTATVPVSLTITQPATLVLTNAGTTNVSCYGQNDGSATVSVSGGVAPYTYVWSNGQSGTTISNLLKGTYVVTVTDANNCSKTQSFTITEPAFVNAPSATNQNFCVGQNATLANIVINGSNIKWYNTATGGTLLPATTALVNGTTYYATQTIGTCESVTRTAVQITLSQATSLTTTQLSVCSNTRVQNMTIDGFNYTQLKWYSSATSTIQLPSSQLLTTGTYYVSSVTGTCESVRQAIQITVAAIVPAPGATAQTVCGNTTLNDLTVVKDPTATLRWYTSQQSMIPLAGTTQVSTTTYYVQQVIGNCESIRVAVQVQAIPVIQPTITSITTCEGTTIADLNSPTVKYVWYTDNTTVNALPDTFVITSGSYYIARENMGCISNRTNVAVNVSTRPASPTGQATQLFNFSAKVSNLVMNEPNVKWFLSANDATKLTNELSATTPLTDATTYYGILTNANNCGSLVPTAVKVTINLSNAELDLTQLKYYPNPVDSELNISYIEEINKVEVFTITGQRVFGNDYQGNEVKVDLSRLSAGTYLVKIETAKASQFVKIVKK